MSFSGNQPLTAYFADRAEADDASADLEAAGIRADDITLHDESSGGGGFLDGIKHFFGADSETYASGTLLTVTGSRELAEPILNRYNAQLRSAASTETYGASTVNAGSEQTMKLREERLAVDKEAVNAGEVRLRKEVVSEQQRIDVPVAHEEVYVSRRAVNDGDYAGDAGAIGDDAEISVPVMREEVSVDKHTVVTEEVGLSKQTVQETQTVGGTVRKERATIDGDFAGQVDKSAR